MSEITLRFRRYGMRPPPLADLLFDVVLHNEDTSAVWFVLPMFLGPIPEFEHLVASSVEVFELPGEGIVRIARFLGGGSFQTLRLPAGATVRISGLPITVAGRPPRADITVPVILARQLKLGTHTADEWLPVDVTSAKEAKVTEDPGAIVASKDTQDGKALPVTLSGARTLSVRVELKS
jgi:hypothetical protein